VVIIGLNVVISRTSWSLNLLIALFHCPALILLPWILCDRIDECKMAAAEDRNMILVMGLTGAGKSYFINKLTDETVVVGNTLRSCE
jgi:hypothetical protein